MSDAQQVLLAYATAVLLLGFGLGALLGGVRMNASSARGLATAHGETLLQGAVLLGLAVAIGMTGFESGTATLGAWLLVVGSALQAFGVTLNWIQNVDDQFATRSIGFYANTISTFLSVPGLVIFAGGIYSGL